MKTMLKVSALLGVLLVISVVYADLAEDIVGTWTLVDPVEPGEPTIIVTFNADGTYVVEIIIVSMRLPVEEGTYVISDTNLILYPLEEEEFRLQNVTVVGDQLSGYDPEEDETQTFQRGTILPEPAGTGSISGTVSYDGEVSSGIMVMAFSAEGFQEEDEPMLLGMAVLTQPGPYAIEGLADGEYVVGATLGPLGQEEPDAMGVYGVDPLQSDFEPDAVVVADGAHVEDIDITLYSKLVWDPWSSVERSSWGAIKALFSSPEAADR